MLAIGERYGFILDSYRYLRLECSEIPTLSELLFMVSSDIDSDAYDVASSFYGSMDSLDDLRRISSEGLSEEDFKNIGMDSELDIEIVPIAMKELKLCYYNSELRLRMSNDPQICVF